MVGGADGKDEGGGNGKWDRRRGTGADKGSTGAARVNIFHAYFFLWPQLCEKPVTSMRHAHLRKSSRSCFLAKAGRSSLLKQVCARG